MSEYKGDINDCYDRLCRIESLLEKIYDFMETRSKVKVCPHMSYTQSTDKGAFCLDCQTEFTWKQRDKDRQWNWYQPR